MYGTMCGFLSCLVGVPGRPSEEWETERCSLLPPSVVGFITYKKIWSTFVKLTK